MTGTAAGFTAPVEDSRPHAVAWAFAPVAVALGSLALGAVALGHRSLSTDEAASLAQARGSLGTVLSRVVHDDPGQAGNLLLLKLASTVGDDERAIRAPVGDRRRAGAPGLLVVLGTMLFGRLEGVVAGIAMAANTGVIEASREARPAASALLGVVVVTLLFVFALERGGGWRWVAYAIAAAALPLTHPLAASVLAAHGAALLARRDREDLRRAGIALLTGTAVAGLAPRLDGGRPLRRRGRDRRARSRAPRPGPRACDRLESDPPGGRRCRARDPVRAASERLFGQLAWHARLGR